jgi:hypothetical protein
MAVSRAVVLGTRNPAKARQCELALVGTGIRTTRLTELVDEIPDVAEAGRNPEENAAAKALTYVRLVGQTVLSVDYALVFEGVADEEQPGPNVRRIPGAARRPTDEELLRYYADLFRRHGGSVKGRWLTGAAAATPDGRAAQARDEVLRTFVSEPCPVLVPGLPLASLQLVGERYVAELDEPGDVAVMRERLRPLLLAVLDRVLI